MSIKINNCLLYGEIGRRIAVSNVMAVCLLLLLMMGCAPSVRYTRDRPEGRPPARQKVAGDGDSLQSGWEAPAAGGADVHQAGWLNSALGEADQGRQEASTGVRGAAPRRLEQVVNSYMGAPYKYGGTTRHGFDCSGFVSAVYREAYGIPLKRTSSAMWKEGSPVPLSAARPGDIVFFKGGAFGAIDHVGIYMGRTRFAHSSTSSGVIYSNLKDTYYARRFAGVRRMPGVGRP